MSVAYVGFFPPSAPKPTLDGLTADWRRAFGDPRFRAFLMQNGNQVVGEVAIRPDPDDDRRAQVQRLYVLPDQWGNGIGGALHERAMTAIEEGGFSEAGLWVLEANSRAREFYERRGWSIVPGVTLEWPGLSVTEVRYRLAVA